MLLPPSRRARRLWTIPLSFALTVALAAGCGASPPPARPAAAATSPAAVRRSIVQSSDGVALAVEEAGPADAPTLVFIHGLGFTRAAWHRQLESSLAARFHLVAYDLRGHGQSARPADPAAYSDGARWGDDLRAVLAATRARHAIVVGWSLGGLAVALYLRDHGDAAIAGVVFVDAVTAFSPALLGPENPRYTAGLPSKDDAARARATHAFIAACFATPLPAAELAALEAAAGVLPAYMHAAIFRMSIDGVDAGLRALTRPALVIQGSADVLVSMAMADHIASLVPGAQRSTYEGVGHAPFLEATPRFDAELAAFAAAATRAAR